MKEKRYWTLGEYLTCPGIEKAFQDAVKHPIEQSILKPLKNLVSALFRLEKRRQPEQLMEAVTSLSSLKPLSCSSARANLYECSGASGLDGFADGLVARHVVDAPPVAAYIAAYISVEVALRHWAYSVMSTPGVLTLPACSPTRRLRCLPHLPDVC
jgi:hypothetical protein